MEYLETKGVPVIGFNTDYLPAFFTNKSKYKVDYNAKNSVEIATIFKEQENLNLENGILVTNPVSEKYSLDEQYINKIIDEAILEMNKLNIKGKDQTPFLLSKIVELTNGSSLETNIELILSNARLGAKIASSYYKK